MDWRYFRGGKVEYRTFHGSLGHVWDHTFFDVHHQAFHSLCWHYRLTYLFTALGIPSEAVMGVLGIEPILALFIAVCNVISNTAVSFVVACRGNMVDVDTYDG